MAHEYWTETWACVECGNFHYSAKTAYCAACGSRSGHKHVMIKLSVTWFGSKIIETRIIDEYRVNKYIKELAKILELEADGEETSYLADAMQTAMTIVNQQ